MMYLIHKGVNGAVINWEKLKSIDIAGVFTLCLGLGSFVYTLEEGAKNSWFEDFHIQITTLLSIIMLTAFIVIQLVKKNPLLNLHVFQDRNFFITSMITMVSGAALYGGIYSLSLYLGQIQSYQASEIGSVIMWLGIPQLIVMPMLPFLMKKMDLKLLIILGILIFAYSNYINAFMDHNYAGDQIRLSLFLRAIGQPLFMIPVSIVGMSLVDHQSAGNASAIFNMLRNIGGSIGVSFSGTSIISRQKLHELEYNYAIENGGSLISEYLYKMEKGLQSIGFDLSAAKAIAFKSLQSISIRDAYIQSFNDIFFILGLSLAFLTIVILFIRIDSHINVQNATLE